MARFASCRASREARPGLRVARAAASTATSKVDRDRVGRRRRNSVHKGSCRALGGVLEGRPRVVIMEDITAIVAAVEAAGFLLARRGRDRRSRSEFVVGIVVRGWRALDRRHGRDAAEPHLSWRRRGRGCVGLGVMVVVIVRVRLHCGVIQSGVHIVVMARSRDGDAHAGHRLRTHGIHGAIAPTETNEQRVRVTTLWNMWGVSLAGRSQQGQRTHMTEAAPTYLG